MLGSFECIFTQTLQTAQLLERHGRAFEEQARSLEEQGLPRIKVQVIEDAGQQIQQQSQSMIALLNQAHQEESDLSLLNTCISIQQQQQRQVLLYYKIIEVLLEATKSALLQRDNLS